MSNKEFEMVLISFTLAMAAMLVLMFIARCVRIFVTKKIKSVDDVCCVLFFAVIIGIFSYCLYKIKKKYKKFKQTVV